MKSCKKSSVYRIKEKEDPSRCLTLFVMPVLLFLMLQYESFHTVFSAPESMSKRLRNCIRGKIPKVDAVRSLCPGLTRKKSGSPMKGTIDTLKKNRVFREGTIGGYVVAGIDMRVGPFQQHKKILPGTALPGSNRAGEMEYSPPECGLHDGRKTRPHVMPGPGNAEAEGRSGKG